MTCYQQAFLCLYFTLFVVWVGRLFACSIFYTLLKSWKPKKMVNFLGFFKPSFVRFWRKPKKLDYIWVFYIFFSWDLYIQQKMRHHMICNHDLAKNCGSISPWYIRKSGKNSLHEKMVNIRHKFPKPPQYTEWLVLAKI